MTELIYRKEFSDREARKTTLVVAGVLLLIAAWYFYRQRLPVAASLGAIALSLILVGLLIPKLARVFHTIWMQVALILGYINSRILLSVMFYGVFTPYGLISRLVGRDPLRRRGTEGASYWTPRKATRQSKEQFERLF